MQDLVLISKKRDNDDLNGLRTGRQRRTVFGIRRYADTFTLAIPVGLTVEGDKIDFFMSASGFAVKIGPDGERSISGKLTARTATIPKEVALRLASVPTGATDLVSDDRGDRLTFFPFAQF